MDRWGEIRNVRGLSFAASVSIVVGDGFGQPLNLTDKAALLLSWGKLLRGELSARPRVFLSLTDRRFQAEPIAEAFL